MPNLFVSEAEVIQLIPTDPWDFVSATGSGPFQGSITAIDPHKHESVVVRLDKPFVYDGVKAFFIQASTRHVGEKFERVGKSKVFCNMISLSDEEGLKGLLAPSISQEGRLHFIGDVSWEAFSR